MTISIDYFESSLIEFDIEVAEIAREIVEALSFLLEGVANVCCYSELDPNFADEF